MEYTCQFCSEEYDVNRSNALFKESFCSNNCENTALRCSKEFEYAEPVHSTVREIVREGHASYLFPQA